MANEPQAFVVAPVKDGRPWFSPAQDRVLAAFLRRMEGKEVRVTFSQPTKTRSNPQNRYYWGVVLTMIAAETGHTTEEVHEYMKAMFLPRCFIRLGKGKKEQQITKSTATLSTFDMEEYLEKVRAFAAAELQLTIPLPNEIS
jgi:hypothetical protein